MCAQKHGNEAFQKPIADCDTSHFPLPSNAIKMSTRKTCLHSCWFWLWK